MKFLLGIVLCMSLELSASVSVSALIGDHMVFQRNEKVVIEGWADNEKVVFVELAGMSIEAPVTRGYWSVEFPARKEGGPFSLSIRGDNELLFGDIYFGDVYLLSGQSNMAWPTRLVKDAEKELKDAFYPLIRVFTVEKDQNYQALDKLNKGQWDKLNTETARDFSGIGFLFARELFKEKGIPIGLIDNAWGGSAIKTYMSEDCFYDKEDYTLAIEEYKAKQRNWAQISSLNEEWLEGMLGSDLGKDQKWFIPATDRSQWDVAQLPGNWEKSNYPDFDGIVWYYKTFDLNDLPSGDGQAFLGRIDDRDVSYINGFKIGKTEGYNVERKYSIPSKYLKKGENQLVIQVTDTGGGGGISGDDSIFYLDIGGKRMALKGVWKSKRGTVGYPERPKFTNHNYFPSGKFNAMVRPLVKQKLSGVLWYQGESDGQDGYNYRWMFPRMIEDWRKHWGQEDLPFMYVQLANWLEEDKEPTSSGWARLREAQHMTQALSNSAMVTAIDVGEAEDIHPRDKKTVAKRLVRAAKALVYKDSIQYLHPELDYIQRAESGYVIHFQQVGSGLKSMSVDGMIHGFAVPDQSGKLRFVEGKVLSDNQVYIKMSQTFPGMVRYLWANNPGEVQLYSEEGLPALPFERYME